ncbi:hypothetical protein CW710_02520 [Candidatus Bathyarchaeota archaeon]|nr:MAG: hypothetical protein CW710_02520 [Candidatus Bathyarchaeota archaeon]
MYIRISFKEQRVHYISGRQYPLNQKELQDVFQAAKTVASWLGIEILTTKTIERYVAVSEKLGFSVRSKAEPYLMKRLR